MKGTLNVMLIIVIYPLAHIFNVKIILECHTIALRVCRSHNLEKCDISDPISTLFFIPLNPSAGGLYPSVCDGYIATTYKMNKSPITMTQC